MGSKIGVIKSHAKRLGFTLEFYQRMKRQGFKWCTTCKEWQPVRAFIRDVTRYDGLSASCRQGQYRRNRATYAKKGKSRRG